MINWCPEALRKHWLWGRALDAPLRRSSPWGGRGQQRAGFSRASSLVLLQVRTRGMGLTLHLLKQKQN